MPAKSRRPAPYRPTLGGAFRKALTVLAATLCGLASGMIAAYGFLILLTGGIKQDGWGAAPALLFLCAIAGLIGGVTAFASSIAWVWHRQLRAYTPLEWLGLALGTIAAAASVHFFADRYHLIAQSILLAAILLPTLTTTRLLTTTLLKNRPASPRNRGRQGEYP